MYDGESRAANCEGDSDRYQESWRKRVRCRKDRRRLGKVLRERAQKESEMQERQKKEIGEGIARKDRERDLDVGKIEGNQGRY